MFRHSLKGISSLNDADQDCPHRKHQKNVKESAHGVAGNHAQQPQDEQRNKNKLKHLTTSLVQHCVMLSNYPAGALFNSSRVQPAAMTDKRLPGLIDRSRLLAYNEYESEETYMVNR